MLYKFHGYGIRDQVNFETIRGPLNVVHLTDDACIVSAS